MNHMFLLLAAIQIKTLRMLSDSPHWTGGSSIKLIIFALQVKDLEKQVSLLNIEAMKKEMSLNEQSKSEYEVLNAKIQQLKADHAQNIKELEEEHEDAIKRLEESYLRDFKVIFTALHM